ncbi:AbrB/MazE/SpoVT family DNA-binding domain-containing protein [Synechococcus sp. PCC 7336]|uniref:AbrB/MazE/SpoVT family DNA-binding domain-containing protein n=1 Tax=Synechococcus sp. PCC 7336 TaxID=195250 RepID=UPI00034BC4AD|nr:AbrB/MazE/SpoVT family DNA-binding domain-containing protein [Synechococcus sp. PCC 7336]
MKLVSATLTSKGQTTIPKQIRDLLHLQPGDRIDFVVDGDRVYLKPANVDVRQLSGILHRSGRKPVSLDEMDEEIAAGACQSAGVEP